VSVRTSIYEDDKVNTRIIPVILLIVFYSIVFSQRAEQVNTCVACHEQLDGALALPVKQIKGSVHDHPGLSCAGCHGGDPLQEDPDLAMSKSKGFVGKPKPAQVPEFCAKCHSNPVFMRNFNPNFPVDQYELYRSSQHGQLLAKGDTKVATCISCHGVHDIKAASDPSSSVYPLKVADKCGECHANEAYMSQYHISTSQLKEYKESYHAQMLYDKGDLTAPTCNDCHGNHGAVPPGVTSIANVCGTCHVIQSQYFSASPHKAAFDELGISECEACHGNHAVKAASVNLIGIDEKAKCVECHDPGSAGYVAAFKIRSTIDSLSREIDLAQAMRSKAQKAGVEVRDEHMSLSTAQNALIQVEATVHTFSVSKVKDGAKEGFQSADEAREIGQNALAEVGRRRKLLAVMVVMTLLVAGLLVLYIREREKKTGGT
jgi:predicted CXXCH cytochrome family protein